MTNYIEYVLLKHIQEIEAEQSNPAPAEPKDRKKA